MLTNNQITIYHKSINPITRLEEWTRFNYSNAWVYEHKSSKANDGYALSRSIEIRVPYDSNDIEIHNINLSDIVVKGYIDKDIVTQTDLNDYESYNIITITNNDSYGINKHIHIEAR